MANELKVHAQSLTEVPLDLIRQILDKHHSALCEELRGQVKQYVNERNHWRDQYQDLIYQVETKHPGESRHETAKRYIRQAEQPSSDQAQAAQPADHSSSENE